MYNAHKPEALLHAEIYQLKEVRGRLLDFGGQDIEPILRRTQCHLDIAIASLERDAEALLDRRVFSRAADDRLVGALVG
jgi:hypothetical protein